MKMQEKNNFQNQIKFMHKKFGILDRPSTKILYEFCQFDAEKTYKVLALGKLMRSPAIMIQILIKDPQNSEQYIESLVARYDSQIGEPVDFLIQKTEDKKVIKEYSTLQFDFFENVPQDTIGTIMCFLDPYSLKYLSFTNSIINKIGKSQALSQLYKQICKALFSLDEPILPFVCRFNSVKRFVQTHPDEYYPYYNNFKNAMTNNLRNTIWKAQPKDFKLDKKYYLSFGSYESMFLKCPRINFNGYYICKHKYVKIGEKDMKHTINPIHIIYYYRYLRFIQDGSVVYHVTNKKIKPEDITKFLSKQVITQEAEESIIGQFMQFKDNVHVKAVKGNSVFCYQIQIHSTDNKICNQLKILNYKLELIDKSYMTQTLYQANPKKQDMIFYYVFNQDIQAQNGPRIQACGL